MSVKFLPFVFDLVDLSSALPSQLFKYCGTPQRRMLDFHKREASLSASKTPPVPGLSQLLKYCSTPQRRMLDFHKRDGIALRFTVCYKMRFTLTKLNNIGSGLIYSQLKKFRLTIENGYPPTQSQIL